MIWWYFMHHTTEHNASSSGACHIFAIRFTEKYMSRNNDMVVSSRESGGSDAVLQTAPEKAATPYTTILIFSSSAAQEITK